MESTKSAMSPGAPPSTSPDSQPVSKQEPIKPEPTDGQRPTSDPLITATSEQVEAKATPGKEESSKAAATAQSEDLRPMVEEEYEIMDILLEKRITEKEFQTQIVKIRDAEAQIQKRIEEAQQRAAQYGPKQVYYCPQCHNRDQSKFIEKLKEGSVCCVRCGTVVIENKMFDGDWTRTFEGDEEKSQFGPKRDLLLGESFSLSTKMRQTQSTTSSLFRALRDSQRNIELGSNNLRDEGKTREGYRAASKKKAFKLMEDVENRLGLTKQIISEARSLFSAVRDVREKLTEFEKVVVLCLLEARRRVEKRTGITTATQEAERVEEEEELFQSRLTALECSRCGYRFSSWHAKKAHNCEALDPEEQKAIMEHREEYTKRTVKNRKYMSKMYKTGLTFDAASTGRLKRQLKRKAGTLPPPSRRGPAAVRQKVEPQ